MAQPGSRELVKSLSDLEKHFSVFAGKIVGADANYEGPNGTHRIIYADWIASGRLYKPVEDALTNRFGPLVANTHSESSYCGEAMTRAYKAAHDIIKKHVNAGPDDVIITQGSGMTGVLAKLQRMMGLRIPDKAKPYFNFPASDRPVVFITHMEHHSNQISWLECEVDVVVIPPDENLLVAPELLQAELEKYKDRKYKIGAFTACSNVTGIVTPFHRLAALMHRYGGLCFIDFAASAPYVNMDMHPENSEEALDAIYFSPHKFLGGPGSTGVLIFNRKLYGSVVPDQPGGGTVTWTNPWGGHSYFDEIEVREDGGTPAFMQTIRAALCVRLKEQLNVDKMKAREKELLQIAFDKLESIPGLHVLAPDVRDRIGAVSFYVDHLHYNFIVRVLSDYFGIQVRGGCSCAGTYGHFLLHVDQHHSEKITSKIDSGDLSEKPGWVRMSIHPTMTDKELYYVLDAIGQVVLNRSHWEAQYHYDPFQNEFRPVNFDNKLPAYIGRLFDPES